MRGLRNTRRVGARLSGGLAILLVFALAGCGSEANRGGGLDLFRQAMLSMRAEQGAASGPSDAEIAAATSAALARVRGSALLALFRDGTQLAVLGEQESRRGYRTYTTTERQTLTLRGGVLVATRGLGHDLMSSNAGGTAALLRARRAGSATRVMRWLDGDWRERPVKYSCRISRDRVDPQSTATEGVVVTLRMVEICRGGAQTFTNFYWVGGDGMIWGSRQWIGPENGYIAIQTLRR